MGTVSAIKNWVRGLRCHRPGVSAESPCAAPCTRLEQIRRRSMDTIADCQTPGSVRVRDRLSRASSVEELWFLRSDIYEVVTRVHCQREAGHRVNALLPAFDRLMPERLLRQV